MAVKQQVGWISGPLSSCRVKSGIFARGRGVGWLLTAPSSTALLAASNVLYVKNAKPLLALLQASKKKKSLG